MILKTLFISLCTGVAFCSVPYNFLFPVGNTATVTMIPGAGGKTRGELQITEIIGGLIISGRITGLSPGLHGFHIHEKDQLGNQCKDAGEHFNPFGANHGGPRDFHRHVGDLGNIYAGNDGVAHVNIFDKAATLVLSPLTNIVARSFVVHEKEDDLGRGGDEGSLQTGNAGSRLACGIVRLNPSRSQTAYSSPEFSPFPSNPPAQFAVQPVRAVPSVRQSIPTGFVSHGQPASNPTYITIPTYIHAAEVQPFPVAG